MTILVRDKEDVLDEMIRYHLERGVDYVIATDNRSVDGTRDILERYAKEGHLHLIDEPGENFRQDVWVTRMARLAATSFGADWIINSDADEFWWPRAGTLKDVVGQLPPTCLSIRTPVSHFVPRRDEAGAFFDRLVVRQVEGGAGTDAPLILAEPPKVIHRATADVEVRFGNHGLARSAPPLPWWPILVLHFPVRTYAQFESKVKLFGAAAERNAVLGRASEDKLKLYRSYQRGELADWYRAWVPTEESIRGGIDAGHMVVDRRLQRFMHASLPALGRQPGGAAADLPEDADALQRAQLRFELERARDLDRGRRARESEQARRLARAQRRIDRLERRLEKARGRLEGQRPAPGARGSDSGRMATALRRLRRARQR